MKTLHSILAFAMLSLNATAENPPPRNTRPAAPVSPELLAGGRVTFRCLAPNAKEIKVSGQFGKELKMEKAEAGLWSVTSGSITPGIYEYHFEVDGMNVLDPFNPAIKPQRNPGSSILHLPSTPPAPWDLTDIPHGTLSQHDYFSKTLGKWRHLMVYTPPGYRSDGPELPVLYLSHGFSDNDQSWSTHGKAHWIMDSLLAAGKAKPMLIVMPDAHALPPGASWSDDYADENTRAFCKELAEDVIPLIEKSYQVNPKPTHRAFAGLSMGGRHALTVAITMSDRFSQVGAFSSAVPAENLIATALENVPAINDQLKLLWIACGKDDFLFETNQSFHALLKQKGVKHEYLITEGNHSWPVWRRYLVDFVPKLFP